MARTVQDLSLLFDVMFCQKSLESVMKPFKFDSDDKVAFVGNYGGRISVEPPILKQIESVIPALQKIIGEKKVERVFPDLKEAFDAFLICRYKDYANDFVGINLLQVKGSIKWNVEMGMGVKSDELSNALECRTRLRKKIDEWMKVYRFFCLPSTQVMPFEVGVEWPDSINGEKKTRYLDWMQIVSEITLLGLPAISIPCGVDAASKLPVGLQIVGRRGCDNELIQFARCVEKELKELGVVVSLPKEVGTVNSNNKTSNKKGNKKK